MVHGNQLLGDGVPLGVVCGEKGSGVFREVMDDEAELPNEVVGVLHADIHALAGLGGVCVDGVAGEEDSDR